MQSTQYIMHNNDCVTISHLCATVPMAGQRRLHVLSAALQDTHFYVRLSC